jgi:peptide/nickel transport system permease protein
MLTHLCWRLGATVVVLAIVAVIVFGLVHLAPGDPAVVIAGENASDRDVAIVRAKLGFDAPLSTQFLRWVGAVATGDLGRSVFSDLPVTTLIGQRIGPTVSLALLTMLFAATLAVLFGVLAAVQAGTWIDRGVMFGSVIAFSLPTFVIGYLLIYIFALGLGWLPVQGYRPLSDGVWPWLRHLILPSLTLGLAYLALIARITRAAMLDVLAADYMRTARAKGVAPVPLYGIHALKNAAVPIVTVVGLGVALLMGGVVVTETVFNLPGIGRLVVDAIAKRDYPIIQGVLLVFSVVYVLINLLVDLSYAVFDPKVRS